MTILLIAIIAQIYWHFGGYDTLFWSMINIYYVMLIIFCVSYILTANFSIATFIFQTFDFWYKLYNLIIWAITSYLVNYSHISDAFFHYIMSTSGLFCVFFYLLMIKIGIH